MGFWDVLRGQTRPRQANLDALFSLPSAAMTLEASLGLVATGVGSVCFRAAEGQAAQSSEREATDLIDFDGGPAMERRVDEFGYTWATVRADPPDVAALVTDLHAINTSLEVQGLGSGLLCSVISFRSQPGPDERDYLVYLYKRGTFYPFAPRSGRTRDALRERQLRDSVGADLPIEEPSRWMPLWGLQD